MNAAHGPGVEAADTKRRRDHSLPPIHVPHGGAEKPVARDCVNPAMLM
jgi:hypothetical protein